MLLNVNHVRGREGRSLGGGDQLLDHAPTEPQRPMPAKELHDGNPPLVGPPIQGGWLHREHGRGPVRVQKLIRPAVLGELLLPMPSGAVSLPPCVDQGIVGQRYDSSGAPRGGEFQIKPGAGRQPAVAAGAAGGTVLGRTRSARGSEGGLGVIAGHFIGSASTAAPASARHAPDVRRLAALTVVGSFFLPTVFLDAFMGCSLSVDFGRGAGPARGGLLLSCQY